jgi:HEAT repeat protein
VTDTTFLYELARDSRTTELVAHLRRSSNPVVRRRAAELLGDLAEHPDRDATEEMVRALVDAVRTDDDDSVRARAIDALYRHGEDSFERLVRELSGADADAMSERAISRRLKDWLTADLPELRMVAATALGRVGDDDSLAALVAATTDPDPRVRARAVESCGLIGHERCLEPLRARLDDPIDLVRERAVRALGEIGSEEALRSLVPIARDDDESLRRMAVEELGQFGSLDPVVVLVRALTDDTDAVQRAALLSLVELFVDASPERTQRVRDAVAEQIASADTRVVVPHALDMASESRRTAVRHNAVWLLGYVADADTDDDQRDAVYDCLIDALGASDDRTARLAVDSLVELGSDELERRLQILVESEDTPGDVTDRAEAVLEGIGGSLSADVVTNAVDYTYVRDPADYTNRHREDDGSDESA